MIVSSSRPRRVLRARADEAAGVHVDDGERLGVVEDEVAARGQVDAPVERRADLGVDARPLEERRLLLVAVDALEHVRRGLLQVADDPLVRALVVDQRRSRSRRRRGRGRSGAAARPPGRRAPAPSLVFAFAWIVFQSRCRKTRSRSMSSADAPSAAVRTMMPPSFGVELLDDLLQPRALGVVEPARDAEPLAVRDEDEEAAGQRDLGRQPRALRLHRVLDGLHHDLLAAGDQVGDLLAVPLALELGHDDLVDVEEAVLLEADLDERGLHAGQDVVDRAEVDVAGDRAALGPLEVDLGDAVVLERSRRAARRRRRRSAARAWPSAAARASAARRRRPCWLARRSWRWLRSGALRSRFARLRLLLGLFVGRLRSRLRLRPCRASCARGRRGCRGAALACGGSVAAPRLAPSAVGLLSL